MKATKRKSFVIMHWIDVDESFPIDCDEVIIALKGGGVEIGYIDSGDWFFSGRGICLNEDVTHWMSMPCHPDYGISEDKK